MSKVVPGLAIVWYWSTIKVLRYIYATKIRKNIRYACSMPLYICPDKAAFSHSLSKSKYVTQHAAYFDTCDAGRTPRPGKRRVNSYLIHPVLVFYPGHMYQNTRRAQTHAHCRL